MVNHLPPGTYSVAADWEVAESPHHEYGIAQVASKGDIKVVLTEKRSYEINGTLRYAEDSPLNSILPGAVELQGVNDLSGWLLEAKVDQSGRFAFPPVASGEYILRTASGSRAFVQTISQSGARKEGDLLVLDSGANDVRLDVELGATRAALNGTLPVDKIVGGKGGVVLESLADGWLGIALADPNGRVSFEDLPPGEYRAYSWADITQVEYRNKTVLTRSEKQSEMIDIDDQSHVSNVTFTLISPAS